MESFWNSLPRSVLGVFLAQPSVPGVFSKAVRRSLQGVSGYFHDPESPGSLRSGPESPGSRLHAGVSMETFCESEYLRASKCSRVSRESFWVGHSSETPGSLRDHTEYPWSLRAFPSLLGVFLAELPSTPESPRSLRGKADTPRSLRPFPESPRSLFWEIPASRGNMRRSRLRSGKCPEESQLFPAGAAGPRNNIGSPRNAMVGGNDTRDFRIRFRKLCRPGKHWLGITVRLQITVWLRTTMWLRITIWFQITG